MVTEVTSKSELEALATKLETEVANLKTAIESINSTLGSVPNYDGIDASSAASTLSSNLTSIATDAETAAKNIKNYSLELNGFDVDDLTSDAESETTTPEIEETTPSTGVTVPPTEETTPETSPQMGGTTYVPNTSTTPGSSAGTNAGTIIGGGITGGIISGGVSDGSNSTNNKPSNGGNVSHSTGTFPSTGQTSSDGRTQRSALTDIVITEGDPNIDISRYHNNIENGFEVTTGNLAYQLCEEDIDLLCAIVAAESDKSYDDALAVITTILNRCERTNWIASHGRDPIAQATAPNQFVVYQHGSYAGYLNGNAPSTVVKAVQDALAGVRNHNYCNFRSNGSTSYSNNMITPTGNRYKNE